MNHFKTILIAASLPFIVLLPLIAPLVAHADSNNIHSNVWDISILQGPLVTCVGAPLTSGTVQNQVSTQCSNLCDLFSTAANVIYFGIAVVIWIITPIMFLWSGIMFMISGGSPEKVGTARKLITGTVIGILIVLCAYLLLYTFTNVLNIQQYIGGFGTGCTPPGD